MGKRNRSSSCTDRGEESKKKRKKQKNSKLGRERKSSLHLPEEKRDDKNQGFESVEEQFSHESERLASLGKPQKNSKCKDDNRVPELGTKVAETGKIDDMCDDDDSDNGDDYADGDGDNDGDDGGGGGISDDDNVCDDDCCDSGDIGEDNFGVDGDIDAGGSVDRETSEFSDKSPSKGKQKNTSGLYRPLTREEMQSLKETENLYKSNLLRLQIKELLSEVSPSEHPKVPEGLEEYLKHLKVFLESLPASDPLSIADAMSSLPKGVKYPLSFSGSYPKVTFSFKPPSSVKVVGSWLVKTYLRKNYDVNLALEMPQSSFQEKDYLGHRYFHKRALYLCRLAGHLKASGLCKKVVFTDFRGDRLTPVLSLVPVDERIKHCTIRLHPHLGKPLTKLIRLAPDRNCVREFTVKKHTLEAERDGDNVLNPTPHYNNALIADTTGLLGTHLEEIFTTAQDCTAFRDAVVLLKVWLHQRKLDQGFGCIGGFLVSILLVYLVRKKKVTRTMSSYQILRVFWSFVSTSAWDEEGISLAQEDSTGPSMDVFNTSFDVVFVDSSGWYNLCSDVDVSKYHRFKHESELALSLLDSTSVDGFEKLFMTSVVFAENFDVLLHVDLSSAAKMYATNAEKCSDHVTSVLDFGDNLRQKLLRDVAVVLSKGLGRRVRLLSFEPKETAEWQVSKKQPSPDSHVTLGLLLDTDHAFGVIEMGPPADSAEALEFRQFWSEKSQMRRFRDGSIKEAVLWMGETAAERRTVPLQIVLYLMEKYFDVPGSAIEFKTGSIEKLLSLPSYSVTKAGGGTVSSTGEENQQKVMKVFSELDRQLRDLSDLPLYINSLQGASPIFRQTEVFPPVAWNGRISKKSISECAPTSQPHCFYPSPDGPVPRYVPAMEVVCQLESSGKWPDELSAIAHVKTAFYASLSEQLSSSCKILSSPTASYVDILKSGYVFRVRIVYERELALMREELKYMSADKGKKYKSHIHSVESALLRVPKLTSVLSGLAHQYPVYGSAARLCKRWISSQMFSNHLSEEAVDLIVAAIFLSPAPHTPPATPLTAFLRFLKLLSQFKWSTNPLVVNFNNELSDKDIADLQGNFASNRSTLPAMFIATPLDRHASSFTQYCPVEAVLAHLQNVCRKAYSVLSDQLSSSEKESASEVAAYSDVKHIFRPSLKTFDILIHLNTKHTARRHLAVDCKTVGEGTSALPPLTSTFKHMPVVGFDPVERFVRELEELYSEFAVFFYDMFGGAVIGAVLKPNLLQPHPFKVSKANCMKATHSKGKLVNEVIVDVHSLASDFQLLGHGLVSLVEITKGT